jgi:aminomethyltransferase
MVPFAGYQMPVQYPAGIMKEHLHTREKAGLFDVSHMGQIILSGASAAAALETLVPADVVGLPANRQRYALFTNDEGGIIDDLMVSNLGNRLLLVVNAACKKADLQYLQSAIGEDCDLSPQFERGLLALQGPAACQVLERLMPGVMAMRFMDAREFEWRGNQCVVSRSGYTGEDGFEISLPAAATELFARTVLQEQEVEPVGLGARDSLRLEAGLCLYGHDIDQNTTPVEACLQWSIGKARRPGGARQGAYPGAGIITGQLKSGVSNLRVGVQPAGRAPIREGTPLHDSQNNEVGTVTSGGFGPSVKSPVAMAMVQAEHATVGNELYAQVRGKQHTLSICGLPFVPHNYCRG